nr:unnamed protein product [Spirometra erinaceieuropaei]
MVEFENVNIWAGTTKRNSESGLVRPCSRVTPKKDNSEGPRSNAEEAYTAVVLSSCLITFLDDRLKDARAPVIMNNDLVSPRLFNALVESWRLNVDTRPVDFCRKTVICKCLGVAQPLRCVSAFFLRIDLHDTA